MINRSLAPAGYEIVRCLCTTSRRSTLLSRLLENASFGLTSAAALLFQPRPDVIYLNTWPIVAAGLISLVARVRRVPLVLSIQDVYPESLISQQRLSASAPVSRFLRRLDGVIARAASALVVISESFAETYRNDRRVPPARVHTVRNWLDASTLDPNGVDSDSFRVAMGVSTDGVLVVYGGNIGPAAGVETLVEAAALLDSANDPVVVVAGAGPNLLGCRRLVEGFGSSRLQFLSPWRTEDTARVLGAADILVLPTRGSQSYVSVPSKLISYMLAARPILALAQAGSDLARTMEEADCGWVIEPDRPDLLAAKLREVSRLGPAELRQRGLAGRDYAMSNLVKEVCLPKLIDIIERAGQDR